MNYQVNIICIFFAIDIYVSFVFRIHEKIETCLKFSSYYNKTLTKETNKWEIVTLMLLLLMIGFDKHTKKEKFRKKTTKITKKS